MADPGVREKLASLGNDPMDMPPMNLRGSCAARLKTMPALKPAGIKPQ